jgi:hypothetical protein
MSLKDDDNEKLQFSICKLNWPNAKTYLFATFTSRNDLVRKMRGMGKGGRGRVGLQGTVLLCMSKTDRRFLLKILCFFHT